MTIGQILMMIFSLAIIIISVGGIFSLIVRDW